MKKKIYPSFPSLETSNPSLIPCAGHHHHHLDPQPPLPPAAPTTLTVWRKSLLFNCNGFTVFDSNGNLVYRVDNYSKSGNQAEIVLMDAAGKPCLTIRRKTKLIWGEQWGIYEGESAANPRFSARKHGGFFQSKALARLSPRCCEMAIGGGEGYEVEGSYRQRRCAVVDEKGRAMAEMQLKEAVGDAAFGLDVFRLVVQPSFDSAVAMAIVVLLEEMIGSKT
ncbi:protein LURP-one-related 8-like [Phalaenopsis equestris]|uniref:protein LURP-one-related 8-like n=1 Tax=Phalaenopsis equestris TaxID=78828 RepID=UPI0009E3B8B2|nr:protein LURP-one-related 8-like [Phalaenopsis equestris]